MRQNQWAALKKLEAAFLACKRAGLCFTGIDDGLIATHRDAEFDDEATRTSACEAMLRRSNGGGNTTHIKTYGSYLDSGGA